MKNFIIIDHSIRDNGGHHYEYALRVLEAAQAAGYHPILAVNRKFNGKDNVTWDVFPVYRFGFWTQSQDSRFYLLAKKVQRQVKDLYVKIKADIAFSWPGLLWTRRNRPTEILRSSQYLTPFDIFLYTILFLLRTIFVFVCGLKVLIPFKGYLGGIVSAIRTGLKAVLRGIKMMLHPPRWIMEKVAGYRKMNFFARDTRRLFAKLQLGCEDIIFIPTLAEPELMGLLKFFQKETNPDIPSWHLLFRRNIYHGREPDYPIQEEGLRPLRNIFRYFQQNAVGQRVYFYTDTLQLTDQYNRLGTVHFDTLPVPVNKDYHGGLPREEEPIKVIYVGDARTEKGYHHLPRIIQDLPPSYYEEKKVLFELQSVFNTSKGEPAAVLARSQLMQYPENKVRLILNSLSTDEYRQFVLQGDILLILYTSERYYARSSGIFIEALMAGKPVVIPAGTWMALQLNRIVYTYHCMLKSQGKVLEKRVLNDIFWNYPGTRINRNGDTQEMQITAREGWQTVMVVPSGATHVLVSFRQHAESQGYFVTLFLEQLDETKFVLVKQHVIAGGEPEAVSVIFPLQQDVLKVCLKLKTAFTGDALMLDDVSIEFLSLERDIPCSTVGMVYADEAEMAGCVKEIVDHYSHYSNSARQFSDELFELYTPDALVKGIEQTIFQEKIR